MQKKLFFIDAGIDSIKIKIFNQTGDNSKELIKSISIANNKDITHLFHENKITEIIEETKDNNKIFITGKLSEIVQKVLKTAIIIAPAAALWSSAKMLRKKDENKDADSLGIIDLSASGYMLISIDKNDQLKNDSLIVNPRCGAGSGINLSRILQKLNLKKNDVDILLKDYLGDNAREKRNEIPIRTDRCGVFSSSATISDKNQGIPLEHALAVTLKSEVKKTCEKITKDTEIVYLTGGVFKWQFARDCAKDNLNQYGIKKVIYDEDQSHLINGLIYLSEFLQDDFRSTEITQLRTINEMGVLPSFPSLLDKYTTNNLYKRIESKVLNPLNHTISQLPVNLGLDIGSTMAKIIISNAETNEILYLNSYENHGDTVETIKAIFKSLKQNDISELNIQNIGLTGSGRYQVQKILQAVYPHLKNHISAIVENYAHARGSIDYAKEHIKELKEKGVKDINEDFCLLIDIGGEDTKVSVISLDKNELFDNAMNVKCSAGTGSLMDTLKTMFNIEDVAQAYNMAYNAGNAFSINATCAVFLMENARKLQAEGYSKDVILASCAHAIIENMARTLWDHVDFPANTVTLLHGQTMLSDPLPLAVTHRIQEYTGTQTYCLVPPDPGHRACVGLIKNLTKHETAITEKCALDDFINLSFKKKIVICRGAACGDKNARCSRTRFEFTKIENTSITLGGCSAINELQSKKEIGQKINVPNSYKEIWDFIESKMPKTDKKNRLVIPRSFAISEQAYFFGKIFEKLQIPVHIDSVKENDIIEGQPYFKIDTCAPNIGCTGQFIRLAREDHGIIVVPQIDFLPTGGKSLGRTCTTNQGGILIAKHFATMMHPESNFKIFNISLDKTDSQYIANQLYYEFKSIFEFYNVTISKEEFIKSIEDAKNEHDILIEEINEKVIEYLQLAITNRINISIVAGREYILNPGIYDSHIGKLLKDKEVISIPSYVIDTELDHQFSKMYWKNPHDILTKIEAIKNKRLHKIINNDKLKHIIKNIETGFTDSLLSVVTVSTFRCGPDSVTLPTINEITKDMPSLLIQSDALISELAHLENRVNTHLNQLEKQLHEVLTKSESNKLDLQMINEYSMDSLNLAKDVLYIPTLGDNRVITSVFRTMGITVIDNYSEIFDIEKKAKHGRKYVGDSTCVPMAVVFSDMLNAVEDFIERKKKNDPMVKGKERIVLFMHGGDGPCRLGQYIDMFKLSFYKLFRKRNDSEENINGGNHAPIKILENISSSLLGKDDLSAEVDKWVGFQAYQQIIIHGLLQSVFIKASALCEDKTHYDKMLQDYNKAKDEILSNIEKNTKPSKLTNMLVNKIGKYIPSLSGPAQYFGYGIYNNNGFRKILKKFSKKWITPFENHNPKIKIHIDGEVYLRVAQVEEISRILIDSIGFRSFELSYSPIWSFFENILEARIIIANKDITLFQNQMDETSDPKDKKNLLNLIKERKAKIKETRGSINNFRNILAAPLYKSASIKMSHPMKEIFSVAEPIIPTFKPFGELVPYVGETLLNIKDNKDLIFNIAPEGCMVSSMGEILTPKILQEGKKQGKIQHLFSVDGEINNDLLQLALLKVIGPENYYKK